VDINGAKALKTRLGTNGPDDGRAVSADVPGDAPLPVYQWLGISYAPSEASSADAEDAPAAESASLFGRLGQSFR
jgi:hypothetical protein